MALRHGDGRARGVGRERTSRLEAQVWGSEPMRAWASGWELETDCVRITGTVLKGSERLMPITK